MGLGYSKDLKDPFPLEWAITSCQSVTLTISPGIAQKGYNNYIIESTLTSIHLLF